MLGCGLMNERMLDDEFDMPEAFDAVFPIWTASQQVQPTLNYLRSTFTTDRPITQSGMDAQVTSQRVIPAIVAHAKKQLAELGEAGDAHAGVPEYLEGFNPANRDERPDPAALKDAASAVASFAGVLLDRVGDADDPLEAELYARTIDDVSWFMRVYAAQLAGDPNIHTMYNERDRRMGDNLAWLAEEYFADRKIIVWAATRHAVHRQKEILYPPMPDLYTAMDSMGETAHERLGDALYTIGFTAGRGEAASAAATKTTTLDPPKEGSIEQAIASFDHPFQYVDLRGLPDGHALRSQQWMRPLGYGWMTAIWPDQFDGLFYIDEMFRSSLVEMVPEGYALTVTDE